MCWTMLTQVGEAGKYTPGIPSSRGCELELAKRGPSVKFEKQMEASATP